MPWTALRTRTSQRCWTRGSATSATTSLSTVSHRWVKNNKLNKNKVDPTTKWTNRPIIGMVSVWLPNEFWLIGPAIIVYSGEPFALPEGQEDLHLHTLPRPDDLQGAVGDQGCGDPDDQGAFTFTLILKSVIISHGRWLFAYLPISNQNQIEGKRRFWITEPNILAQQRGLGSDLLSSTTWSFQGEEGDQRCRRNIKSIVVAGPEGGFCGPWGELETDLRCSWAGGKSHNIINKNKNNQKFVPFERLTSCQLKDSLPLHEPWHSDLPNFLRLVIIIRPPYYQNNDTIFFKRQLLQNPNFKWEEVFTSRSW